MQTSPNTTKEIDAQSVNTVITSRSVQMAKNKGQLVPSMNTIDFTSPTERFRRNLHGKNNEIPNKGVTSLPSTIFGESSDAVVKLVPSKTALPTNDQISH